MAKRHANQWMGRCVPWLLLMLVGWVAPVMADAAVQQPTETPVATSEASTDTTEDPRPQILLPKPPDTPVPSREELVRLVDRTSEKFGLEAALVHAIVRAESNYNPHAVSHAGAVGLMQVMPKTAADYGVTSVDKLFDPAINARTGARHLKRLLGKYSIGKAVMAYNAGEGALERSNGFVTFAETQIYTHRVLTSYLRVKGVEPYSAQARELTGIGLSPAMAQARAQAVPLGNSRAAVKEISRLKLRLQPTWLDSPLSKSALDPRMHRAAPQSKPMFVLEGASVMRERQ